MQLSEKRRLSIHDSITTAVIDLAGILLLLLTAELYTQASLLGHGNRNVPFPKYFSFYMWKYWLWHSCWVKEVYSVDDIMSLFEMVSQVPLVHRRIKCTADHAFVYRLWLWPSFPLLSFACCSCLPSELHSMSWHPGNITRLGVTVKGLSLVP